MSKVLNNQAYYFKINKEISTQTYISISATSKETVSYKKITLSVNNLRLLFKELISSTYSILVEKLLLDISKSLYKHITLEEFSKLKDQLLSTLYKCFRDLSLNLKVNNNFLKDLVFKDSFLFNRFFNLKNNSLILNKDNISIYFSNLLEFKKYYLLLVYLTSNLLLRGTKLITLRYLNSFKDKREIFLDINSSLFILNISYYKSQSLNKKKALNIKYLLTSVSKIFLLYIILVNFFINFLNINILSSKKLKKTSNLVLYYFLINS